jgi:hypothetical protein
MKNKKRSKTKVRIPSSNGTGMDLIRESNVGSVHPVKGALLTEVNINALFDSFVLIEKLYFNIVDLE